MSWNWISELERHRQAGRPLVLVTVTACTGSTPRDTGAKMIVLGDGTFQGTIGGGHLEQLAIEDALRVLEEDRSQVVRYPLGAKTGQCCGGVVELLLEVIGTQPRLYLFGAGHVGQAIARTLAGTSFEVHAIDERPEWIEASALGDAVRHPEEFQDFIENARWDAEKTYAVVMTHRHDDDQAIVEALLRRPIAYLGLIGSHSKWERFRGRLLARGFSESELARVKCPIGLVATGKAPQEIAVSFAAEILEHWYAKRSTTVGTARGREVESHLHA